ncbi:MAG: 1,4-dihydroxy-6-naphthoate synthase [Deltaproteobacteria bacterium]|nr:1,4-dihydroxy-6-naphthoate synthase [Deltaproteobacteria bacterium]
MTRNLSLGYSTCPNDTLIFYAMAHGAVDCRGISYDISLADVELLNQRAKHGSLDITKISFAALGHLTDTYGLLRSGAALGRGCGPLLVAREGVDISRAMRKPVAVPGLWTTACMLLGMFSENLPPLVPMVFDEIMPAIEQGRVQSGVIIHEGRFTYERYGLKRLIDLGQWWESETGLPIPLGGIAIRRNLSQNLIRDVQKTLHASVSYGMAHRDDAAAYITAQAQEMAPDVIDQHIELYVNDFTVDLGDEGMHAVEVFYRLARERGMVPDSDLPLIVKA